MPTLSGLEHLVVYQTVMNSPRFGLKPGKFLISPGWSSVWVGLIPYFPTDLADCSGCNSGTDPSSGDILKNCWSSDYCHIRKLLLSDHKLDTW